MKIKKQLAFHALKYIVGIHSLIFIAACNTKSDHDKMVFRYNEQTGIASLDPAFAKNQSIIWAVHQLYNTLVETDKDLNIRPSLARSWDLLPDGLTYRFHLHTDVFFQDNEAFPGSKGRKLVADDVVFSLSRIMDKSVASSGAWILNGKVDPDSAFKSIDDSTFQLKLNKPFNPILGLLSMQYCSIVPKEVVNKWGRDFRSHPCGTGPFSFGSWEEGQSLIFYRNENYFETDSTGKRLPYLDAIKISFFDNRAMEFLLLQQGQLDFANDLDPSFKDEVLTKKGELRADWQGKIVLSKHAYLNTEYLGILVDSTNDLVRHSPLRIKKLRQAINYGFDRRKMILYLRNSIGLPAESGFVPAGLPSFDSTRVKGYHFDLSKSRQLLAEAGFQNGKGIPQIKVTTVSIYADLASFIAKELEQIGIDLQVDVVQKSLLLEETAQSKAMFFRGSWIADYPDAENFLSVFYSKNPAPPNYTRYKNPNFDHLYERSLEESRDSLRFILYQQMDQLMIDDSPVIPLWYDEVIRLVSPRLRGFEPNGLNLLELRKVKKI
jgi:oligopeptide transport system substrate-binding protein